MNDIKATDYMSEAPLYPSDYNTQNNQTPYSKNNSNQSNSTNQVNQKQPYSGRGNGINVTYRTPCRCWIYVMICHCFFLIIFGTTIFFIMMSQKISIWICLIPHTFTLIGLLIGIFGTYGTSINVDPYFGIITITDRKLFCCRKRKVQINELQQIIVENYVFHGYEYDSNYSRIIFKLVDGKEVKGFDILDDNSKEGRNAYAILKSGVPQNIAFGGNLAY